ncbi:MAG: hypothetical protein WKF80_06940 [Thermomicrobiales bacterium]
MGRDRGFSRHRAFRCLVALVLLLVSASRPGPGEAQVAGASLTIHYRECPIGFLGPDIYGTCHALVPEPGVSVTIDGAATASGSLDGRGDVTFDDIPAGLYTVMPDRFGGDFTRRVVACTDAAAPGVPIPVGLGVVAVPAGTDVVCDWYVTNPDLSGEPGAMPPTPAPPAALQAGTELVIRSWACSDDYADADYLTACRNEAVDRTIEATRANRQVVAARGVMGETRFDLGGESVARLSVWDRTESEDRVIRLVITGCTAEDDRALPVVPEDGQSGYPTFVLPIIPGETVACDWYVVPAPA